MALTACSRYFMWQLIVATLVDGSRSTPPCTWLQASRVESDQALPEGTQHHRWVEATAQKQLRGLYAAAVNKYNDNQEQNHGCRPSCLLRSKLGTACLQAPPQTGPWEQILSERSFTPDKCSNRLLILKAPGLRVCGVQVQP
jgi:hypothetical protein